MRRLFALALTASVPLFWHAGAEAACAIANSNCYPWRIGGGARTTTILEVVPNNAVTSVIYRICLCPPATSVDVIFRYPKQDIAIGTLEAGGDGPLCRDYRIQTSRASQLLVGRAKGTGDAVEGCYTALPALP